MLPYLALQWEDCQSSDQAHDAHEPGPLRSSLWVICTTAPIVTQEERLPVTHKTSPKRLDSQELVGSCLKAHMRSVGHRTEGSNNQESSLPDDLHPAVPPYPQSPSELPLPDW